MLAIVLNGQAHSFDLTQGQHLAALVNSLSLTNQAIAVAVNRQVIPRAQWENYEMQEHDQVDVVRAIGGG
jgi:sulfur carrier protein